MQENDIIICVKDYYNNIGKRILKIGDKFTVHQILANNTIILKEIPYSFSKNSEYFKTLEEIRKEKIEKLTKKIEKSLLS